MFNMAERDQWLIEKQGKFSSSEIGKLLIGGKKGELFGAGAMTYIRQKAVEEMTDLWERPAMDEVKSFLNGKVYEEPAFEMYKKVSRNYSMRYFGSYNPLYLSYNEHSGGSPDGIMGEGETILWTLELKCPINPSVHFDHLGFKSQWDLKEYNQEYYAQVQFILMITKADGTHWCSYSEIFKDPKKKIKIIDVLPDGNFQNNIEVRLLQAIKEKNKIIESFNEQT